MKPLNENNERVKPKYKKSMIQKEKELLKINHLV